MTKAKKERYKDLASLYFYAIAIIIIAWVTLSTVEVWHHNAMVFNGKPDEYCMLNFYQIIHNL